MQKLILILGVLFALAQNALGQEKVDSTEVQYTPLKSKIHFGLFGSKCSTTNAGGFINQLPLAELSPVGSTYFTCSNIKRTPSIGTAGGIEVLTKESGRWVGAFSAAFHIISIKGLF